MITINNLSEKLNSPEIGPWSVYYLAEKALRHYFPFLEEETAVEIYCNCLEELGFQWWNEVAIKYHNEVGFKENEIHIDWVNEY